MGDFYISFCKRQLAVFGLNRRFHGRKAVFLAVFGVGRFFTFRSAPYSSFQRN